MKMNEKSVGMDNMENDNKKLAMRIKEIGNKKGIMQARLARLINLIPNFIGRIESKNSKWLAWAEFLLPLNLIHCA